MEGELPELVDQKFKDRIDKAAKIVSDANESPDDSVCWAVSQGELHKLTRTPINGFCDCGPSVVGERQETVGSKQWNNREKRQEIVGSKQWNNREKRQEIVGSKQWNNGEKRQEIVGSKQWNNREKRQEIVGSKQWNNREKRQEIVGSKQWNNRGKRYESSTRDRTWDSGFKEKSKDTKPTSMETACCEIEVGTLNAINQWDASGYEPRPWEMYILSETIKKWPRFSIDRYWCTNIIS
ncbi:hypothetical protein L9F63_021713 [Diploptera punctata]|uniref:Uncharacterized protein n=1 Tax=Diploptera punctata TaxID=6984 RepID=A0AAD7ZNB8_DIPPU|nr:hypothetical protein L9F63_021713 [Diploptera punctata]